MPAVSQKQIAEKLGVSISLVSRVLSGNAKSIRIAPETIRKVLTAAKEMGYTPNAAALSLIGKATRTLGVVVYDFRDPFFGQIIEELQDMAHAHGHSLVLVGFKGRQPEASDLTPLHKHTIDGMIVIGSDLDAQWLSEFDDMPVARIGHGAANENSFRVAIDEPHAANQLTAHLASQNYSDLIFISGDVPSHKLRQTAFAQAAKNIPFRSLVVPAKTPFETGVKAAQKILNEKYPRPALACATDQIAIGVLHTLHEHELPEHIGVTGFDDIPAAAQFVPPITTIRQPIQKIVQTAVQAIIDTKKPEQVYLPGELLIRQSA